MFISGAYIIKSCFIHIGILPCNKKEWMTNLCNNMDESLKHHVNRKNLDTKAIYCIILCVWHSGKACNQSLILAALPCDDLSSFHSGSNIQSQATLPYKCLSHITQDLISILELSFCRDTLLTLLGSNTLYEGHLSADIPFSLCSDSYLTLELHSSWKSSPWHPLPGRPSIFLVILRKLWPTFYI